MNAPVTNTLPVLKYEVEVGAQGHVELTVPFASGSRIVVYVRSEGDEACADLLTAAESSLAFWDNPFDDEDWNHA